MFVGEWKYGAERPLAAGHHFQSYAARDRISGKQVFLKVEHDPERLGGDGFSRAHLHLWKSLAPISLEGVPRILDHGRKDGRVFLVTEWIDGEPLRSLLRRADPARFAPDFLNGLFGECRRILEGIHARGLLHGDISPGNIMVGKDGRIHLIDLAPAPFLTGRSRTIVGTPAYMAPSLRSGRKRGAGDDFFALNKVMDDAAVILMANAASPESAEAVAATRRAWELPTRLYRTDEQSRADWEGGTEVTRQESHAQTQSNWDRASKPHTVPLPHPKDENTIRADFVVFAPEYIIPGQPFFVELWIGPEGESDTLITQAAQGGRMVERGGRRYLDLARDLLLTVGLRLPAFEVLDPIETLGWDGDVSNAGFIVTAPQWLKPGIYPGIVKLKQDQIPFATIAFDLEVVMDDCPTTSSGPRDTRVQRIEQAFASYAQQDRAEVLRRVQGMTATGTEVFVDVVSQRAGTAWQETLHRKIEESDGLFLFWSRHAAASAWVEMEWRHALAHHGIDFIHPVALEDPRDVAPPPELAGKHFNDMLLPFIFMEDSRRRNPDRDRDRRDSSDGR